MIHPKLNIKRSSLLSIGSALLAIAFHLLHMMLFPIITSICGIGTMKMASHTGLHTIMDIICSSISITSFLLILRTLILAYTRRNWNRSTWIYTGVSLLSFGVISLSMIYM